MPRLRAFTDPTIEGIIRRMVHGKSYQAVNIASSCGKTSEEVYAMLLDAVRKKLLIKQIVKSNICFSLPSPTAHRSNTVGPPYPYIQMEIEISGYTKALYSLSDIALASRDR